MGSGRCAGLSLLSRKEIKRDYEIKRLIKLKRLRLRFRRDSTLEFVCFGIRKVEMIFRLKLMDMGTSI